MKPTIFFAMLFSLRVQTFGAIKPPDSPGLRLDFGHLALSRKAPD